MRKRRGLGMKALVKSGKGSWKIFSVAISSQENKIWMNRFIVYKTPILNGKRKTE